MLHEFPSVDPMQQQLVTFIRDLPRPEKQQSAEPGGAFDLPRNRLELYRRLVLNRFRGTLNKSLPKTLRVLRKVQFEKLLSQFMTQRASQSPYLRDIPREFIEFALDSEFWPSDPKFLPDLACYELASFETAAADDDEPPVSNRPPLSPDSTLAFQRAATVLELRYRVHEFQESVGDAAHRLHEESPVTLLAFRNDALNVRFLELSPVAAPLVLSLLDGKTLEAALLRSAEMNRRTLDDEFLGGVSSFLHDLESRGIIQTNT